MAQLAVPYSEFAPEKLAAQVLSVPPVAVEPAGLVARAELFQAVERATATGQCQQAG
jgi:hypothetical protein